QGLRVEEDKVFFERASLSDDLPFPIQDQAGAVEDKAVVASNLIDQHDRTLCWRAMLASMSRRSSRLPIQKGDAEIFSTKLPPARIKASTGSTVYSGRGQKRLSFHASSQIVSAIRLPQKENSS